MIIIYITIFCDDEPISVFILTPDLCDEPVQFFFRSPESATVRMKMVYASSKDRFKRELDGIQYELQATDASEMSFDIIKSRAN